MSPVAWVPWLLIPWLLVSTAIDVEQRAVSYVPM